MLLPVPDRKETAKIVSALRELAKRRPDQAALLSGPGGARLLRGLIRAGAEAQGLGKAAALAAACKPKLQGVDVQFAVHFK